MCGIQLSFRENDCLGSSSGYTRMSLISDLDLFHGTMRDILDIYRDLDIQIRRGCDYSHIVSETLVYVFG